MPDNIVNFHLHIPPENITYYNDLWHIHKTLYDEYYSVSHYDLDEAKRMMIDRLQGNIRENPSIKPPKSSSLIDLIKQGSEPSPTK